MVCKKKSFFPYWIGFLFSTLSDCLQRTVMIKTYQVNWPPQMSSVAGTSFAFRRARDLGNRASPPSHMNTLKLEVIKRDLGNWASCEEALSSALKRI